MFVRIRMQTRPTHCIRLGLLTWGCLMYVCWIRSLFSSFPIPRKGCCCCCYHLFLLGICFFLNSVGYVENHVKVINTHFFAPYIYLSSKARSREKRKRPAHISRDQAEEAGGGHSQPRGDAEPLLHRAQRRPLPAHAGLPLAGSPQVQEREKEDLRCQRFTASLLQRTELGEEKSG